MRAFWDARRLGLGFGMRDQRKKRSRGHVSHRRRPLPEFHRARVLRGHHPGAPATVFHGPAPWMNTGGCNFFVEDGACGMFPLMLRALNRDCSSYYDAYEGLGSIRGNIPMVLLFRDIPTLPEMSKRLVSRGGAAFKEQDTRTPLPQPTKHGIPQAPEP